MSLHNFPMDTETCSLSLQSFAYDTDEIVLMFDANAINAAKEADPNALFMDINLVNNMPKFKIIDHGYNYSKSDFMIQEEGNEKPQGNENRHRLYISGNTHRLYQFKCQLPLQCALTVSK